MPDNKETIVSFPMPEQNIIQNFVLVESALRGRMVRLGSVLHDIVETHKAPKHVAKILAETVTMTAVLSSMLKYEGVFILQIQGDGPLGMVVCDVSSEGNVRACFTLDKEKYDTLLKEQKEPTLKQMLGKGHLAFTVDQGPNTDRYQGIVALDGETIEDCIQHYFEQSEQVETVVRLTVDKQQGQWRAGGIMIQRMPLDDKGVQNELKEKNEEDWVRSSILLKTCKDEELLDEKLHENTLLMRLFHEEGVSVLDTKSFQVKCRCSEERLIGVIATMPKDDIAHILEDGKISMTCEFCKKTYAIAPPDELL